MQLVLVAKRKLLGLEIKSVSLCARERVYSVFSNCLALMFAIKTKNNCGLSAKFEFKKLNAKQLKRASWVFAIVLVRNEFFCQAENAS